VTFGPPASRCGACGSELIYHLQIYHLPFPCGGREREEGLNTEAQSFNLIKKTEGAEASLYFFSSLPLLLLSLLEMQVTISNFIGWVRG
jgi:hypothetical protein